MIFFYFGRFPYYMEMLSTKMEVWNGEMDPRKCEYFILLRDDIPAKCRRIMFFAHVFENTFQNTNYYSNLGE